jgi:uncharacterized membrane protein
VEKASKQRAPSKTGMLLGVASGLVLAAALWASGVNTRVLARLSFVAVGLLRLFPLAALGPKTEEQRASRKREAVAGVVSVIIGQALVVTDESMMVRVLLAMLACAGALAPHRTRSALVFRAA